MTLTAGASSHAGSDNRVYITHGIDTGAQQGWSARMLCQAARGVRGAGFVWGRGAGRQEGGPVPTRWPSSPPLTGIAGGAAGCGTGSGGGKRPGPMPGVKGRGSPGRRVERTLESLSVERRPDMSVHGLTGRGAPRADAPWGRALAAAAAHRGVGKGAEEGS